MYNDHRNLGESVMTRKYRKRVSSEVKIDALKKHVMKQVPISEICEELGVQPSAFYSWQRELFARGARVFDKKPGPKKIDKSAETIGNLESKIAKKDSVIAELLEDHIKLKKSLGEA